MGSIAAGTPIEAIQQEVDRVALPEDLQNRLLFQSTDTQDKINTKTDKKTTKKVKKSLEIMKLE